MSENNNASKVIPQNTKSIGFFDWLSNTFSKPYLIFILWWIVINLDLVLILLGKYNIWLQIKTEYGGILKTKIGISFNENNIYSNIWYIVLYNFLLPLFGTLITVIVLTPLINTVRICAVFIENTYREISSHMQKKSIKKQKINEYKLTEEYDEYIKNLAKILNSYENIKLINQEIPKLFHKYSINIEVGTNETNSGEKENLIRFLKNTADAHTSVGNDIKIKDNQKIPQELTNQYYYLEDNLNNSVTSIQEFIGKLSSEKLEQSKEFIVSEIISTFSFKKKLQILFNFKKSKKLTTSK
jgi:hypothetical protein